MSGNDNPAHNVWEVLEFMRERQVSLGDLELYGFIENRDASGGRNGVGWEPEVGDLKVSVDEAFNTLTAAGFNLWGDNYAANHYYDATNDHVAETLERHGLLVTEDDEEDQ